MNRSLRKCCFDLRHPAMIYHGNSRRGFDKFTSEPIYQPASCWATKSQVHVLPRLLRYTFQALVMTRLLLMCPLHTWLSASAH